MRLLVCKCIHVAGNRAINDLTLQGFRNTRAVVKPSRSMEEAYTFFATALSCPASCRQVSAYAQGRRHNLTRLAASCSFPPQEIVLARCQRYPKCAFAALQTFSLAFGSPLCRLAVRNKLYGSLCNLPWISSFQTGTG